MQVGLHSLNCFLPDDKLLVGALLRQPQLAEDAFWAEKLKFRIDPTTGLHKGGMTDRSGLYNQMRGGSQHSQSDRTAEDDNEDDDDDDEVCDAAVELVNNQCQISELSVLEHRTSEAPYIKISDEKRVGYKIESGRTSLQAQQKGEIRVEVLANGTGRTDLCLLCFFQEIAELVGKNDLFKRSACLVRAWWVYEARTYIPELSSVKHLKHYLSDFTIIVMLAAVFNRYHEELSSPLQVLAVFFAEYSDVDWANNAVTIQGVVPFGPSPATGGPSLPLLSRPQPNHLVSSEMMLKYWDLFHLTGAFGVMDKKRKSETGGQDADEHREVSSEVTVTDGGSTLSLAARIKGLAAAAAGTGSTSTPASLTSDDLSSSDKAGFSGSERSNSNRLGVVDNAHNTSPTSLPSGSGGEGGGISGGVDGRLASLAARVNGGGGPESPDGVAAAGESEPTVVLPHVKLLGFERCDLNVVHPFSLGNMAISAAAAATGKQQGNRLEHVTQLFKLGASKFAAVLQCLPVSDSTKEDAMLSASESKSKCESEIESNSKDDVQVLRTTKLGEALGKFFGVTLLKFGKGARPDGEFYCTFFHSFVYPNFCPFLF